MHLERKLTTMRYVLSACFTLALFLLAFRPFRDFSIHGIVKNQQGLPVSGVTVMEKQDLPGHRGGTATGADGSFTLTVSSKNAVLIFQMVGYEQQEVILSGDEKPVSIILKNVAQELKEVEVTGYRTQRKKDLTGAVVTIKAQPSNLSSPATRTPVSGVAGRASGFAKEEKRRKKSPYDKYLPQNTDSERFNTEEYDAITENRFLTASQNPLSTFSIDVDAGSYSNVRRFLQQGELPPAGAVRIEELINYFHYDYPQPVGSDPFTINTEIGDCAWNPKHKLLMIGLQGKRIPFDKLPISNLVFLIDVSGSMMEPDKLPLVQQSLKLLVDQLREQDRVSLVVYAGNAGLVMPSTSGNEKTKIRDAIDRLEAGGSTAGGAGIQLAYKVAQEHFVKDGNNRVILCTDGDFNVGPSSNDELERMIEKEKKTGVFLTVLGYGMGNYKDSKLEKLADKGNGNHAYIDNESEAKKVLVNEFGGTLFTIAKDVKLQIEFNPARVLAYRLIGYENRMLNKEDFNNDQKDAGELGSGHTVTALYEIIPVGVTNEFSEAVDSLRYQKNIKSAMYTASGNEIMTIKFRYKNPDSEKSSLIERVVMDQQAGLKETSSNFRFVSAVAQFGMLLRNSEFKQQATYQSSYILAKNAVGKDTEGYRSGFLQLIQRAHKLARHENSIGEDELSQIK
jgi:Ca-activated chloride channel family protein